MKLKRSIVLGFIGFLIFSIAATYITWPLIFHLGDKVTGFGDEFVIAWIQNWVIHALTTNPASLFEANLYYPYHNTLAFSETFIVTSILALPLRALVGEPVATVNFTFLSSLVLLGFSVYLLCFYLTKKFFISLFSGLLIIFSPAILDYKVHLQVLSLECVPLSILFFLYFIKTQQSRYLGVSLFFLVLQTYNSIMPGYFILSSYVVILLFNLISNKKRTLNLISVKNIFLLMISIIPMTFIALPYYSVSNQFHYVRDIRDAIHLAMQPEDFLYPGTATRLQNVLMSTIPTNHYSQNSEFKPGYLGFVFSILVIFTVWHVIRNFKKNSLYLNAFFVISLVGLILSFGPTLHLGRHTIHKPFPIPLPYALFYYVLPGFQGFRNSGRWNMLFILCITVTIALVLNKMLENISRKKRLVIYTLLFVGVVAEFNFPMKFYPVPQKKDFPAVYSWLATTKPDTKIIELPIYNWNMDPFTEHEIYREYYGTIHFRKTVNGYTGFSPPPWQQLVTDMTVHFPFGKTIKELKQMDISYVIVHTDEYDACSKTNICGHQVIKNGKEIMGEIQNSQLFKVVKQFNDTYVLAFK
jgi:hypothetical protein